MNYILKLQADNDALNNEVHALRAGINGLRRHLTTSKFNNDTSIQVGDVERYCLGIMLSGTDAHDDVMAGAADSAAAASRGTS